MSLFYMRILFVLFSTNNFSLKREKKKKEERERGDIKVKGSREGPSKRAVAEQRYSEISMVLRQGIILVGTVPPRGSQG